MSIIASLSHTELLALRDDALRIAQSQAQEHAMGFPASEGERIADEMVGAMSVYGACERMEQDFYPCKGIREVGEDSVAVGFNEEAVAFLSKLRGEYRSMTEDQRGTIESTEGTVAAVFILFVLDGIFAQVDQAEAVSV